MLRRVLALDEGNANAYVLLGSIALRRSDHRRARRYFAQALKLDPTNVTALEAVKYFPGSEDES
jgi:cytochrome c-type biogenesis protein CcmH/NrfG